MAGWVAGAVLAVWVSQVVQEAVDQAAQERHLLQAQLAEQQAQWGKVQKAQSAQQKWHVQSAHLAQIQSQHAGWQALHFDFQNELGPASVQIMRLQLEATIPSLNACSIFSLEKEARPVAQRMDEKPTL
jgi:Tfp pilus assembly protein PilN